MTAKYGRLILQKAPSKTVEWVLNASLIIQGFLSIETAALNPPINFHNYFAHIFIL